MLLQSGFFFRNCVNTMMPLLICNPNVFIMRYKKKKNWIFYIESFHRSNRAKHVSSVHPCTMHTPLLPIYHRLITMETWSNRQLQDHNNPLPHRGRALKPHLTEVSEALRVAFGVYVLKTITHLEGSLEVNSIISKPSRNPLKMTRDGHTENLMEPIRIH